VSYNWQLFKHILSTDLVNKTQLQSLVFLTVFPFVDVLISVLTPVAQSV
jgi:hypothetical protein